MTVTRFQISKRELYADGKSFGAYGPFERIDGHIEYAVDPHHPANADLVDLALAPRTAGSVAFSGDVTLIAPAKRCAEALLVDIPNRGRRLAFSLLNRAAPADLLRDPCAAGDGFLFRRGFAVASVGWQWDVREGMRLAAPRALAGSKPRGDVVCRVQPDRRVRSLAFGDAAAGTFAPSDGNARLFRQRHDDDDYVLIRRSSWRFESGGGPRVDLDGGFYAGRVYTLVYAANDVPVVGAGLLALRDAAAALRAGDGRSPLAYGFDRVHAFGASQTGRLLRHFLALGLNTDEDGGRVFDGVLAHIAGGQRGDFNHRFAQPGNIGVPGPGQTFPFAAAPTTDPLTGETAGLFDAETTLPKVVFTNTSWEYWRGDAALIHTHPGGGDLEAMANERWYAFAGTHHINGVMPPAVFNPSTGASGRYMLNVVDFSPLLRAALVNLHAWAANDVEPPPNAVPRFADGTAAGREEILNRFESRLGIQTLDAEQLGHMRALDLGPDANRGICRFPARRGPAYPSPVSNVDDDLNETAGVRLPDISVPVGSHTGWNPRHPKRGAPGQHATFLGFTRFLDVRTRYASRSEYACQARAATRDLIVRRHLLVEDEDLVVANCLRRYDAAMQHAQSQTE